LQCGLHGAPERFARPLKTAGDRLSGGAHWRALGAQPLHWKDHEVLSRAELTLYVFEQPCGESAYAEVSSLGALNRRRPPEACGLVTECLTTERGTAVGMDRRMARGPDIDPLSPANQTFTPQASNPLTEVPAKETLGRQTEANARLLGQRGGQLELCGCSPALRSVSLRRREPASTALPGMPGPGSREVRTDWTRATDVWSSHVAQNGGDGGPPGPARGPPPARGRRPGALFPASGQRRVRQALRPRRTASCRCATCSW
jgi:hypothetical protein